MAGCCTLHILCGNYSKFNDPIPIQEIISMWPKVLNLANITGQTPVHILCTQWKNIAVENIHHISNNFKININAVDCDGNTPLHVLVATSNRRAIYPAKSS
jgi:hypothetical protein